MVSAKPRKYTRQAAVYRQPPSAFNLLHVTVRRSLRRDYKRQTL